MRSQLICYSKLDARLRIVALIDLDEEKAREVLQSKQNSLVALGYQNTKIFASVQDAAASLSDDEYPR